MKTPLARFPSLLFALGFLGVLTAADSPFTDGKWVDLTHEFSSDTLNKAVNLTLLRSLSARDQAEPRPLSPFRRA